MSSYEISDDEDTVEAPRLQKPPSLTKPEAIEISDDDSNETVLYDNDCYTSDDEFQHPEVNLHKKNQKHNNTKASSSKTNDTFQPSTSLDQRDKILKNLFPVRNKPVPSSEPLPQKAPGHTRMIGGVQVEFPVLPYGAQIALASKVIQSINKKVNCLLESPTGSGKTLALLCGALSWQRHETARIANCQAQQCADQHPDLRGVHGALETIASPPKEDRFFSFTKAVFGEKSIYDNPAGSSSSNVSPTSAGKRLERSISSESPEAGLVSIHKKRRVGDTPDGPQSVPTSPDQRTPEKQNGTPSKQETPPQVSSRVPTIYYGARTHKQIEQVVKEFAKTTYCGEAKMTILSSREHSCIRPFDRSLYPTKNDMCKECIKKVKTQHQPNPAQTTNCKYYENRKELTWDALPPAFDLEDLISAGHETSACPFFAARAMVAGAQIIFCPYNYLIDPSIRSSLQIELKDEIVILDEAHNIEDICRDAATTNFNRDHIISALNELEYLAGYSYANQDIMPEIFVLMNAMKNWNDWFGNQLPLVANKPLNNNEAWFCWQVENFVQTLNNHNIGVKNYAEFQSSAEMFTRKLRDDPASLFGVTQSTGTTIESIATVLGYLFNNECKHMQDFKPALIRSVHYEHGWQSRSYDKNIKKELLSLRVMCMLPGVVFASLAPTRCVLLASGTLTPQLSLRSELAASFPLAVSPSHVIESKRVWLGTLSTTPAGHRLECSSAHTSRTDTQDALGAAVRSVCAVTPHGVLCFIPSYSLMNKLQLRWQETGLWQKLGELKYLFMESRNSKDHAEIMEEYYKCVKGSKGALLFAVYRGKVSEGMDFKDEQARAVITIGIPYPNTFDMSVKEKMLYNDKHSADKHLLPSREWLRVQAYRALNQAIGRCVRHRRDWGAVLLVDARFSVPYYTEHLSSWVKGFLGNNHHTFDSLTNSANSLDTFMQTMTLQEREEDCL